MENPTHLPLRQRSLPPALDATSHLKGNSNSLWMYQEELINLYWVRDMPLREVREIMKNEHGLDVSAKVYKYQFRRWGIRKNLKRQEALELASGQKSSSAFWPGVKDEEYASRVARHLRTANRRSQSASPSHAQSYMAISTRIPPRRIRAPDTLEKVETTIYSLRSYIDGRGDDKTETSFKIGQFFEEQEAFSKLFPNALDRVSRNDQPHQAFQDINRAFDSVKQMVKRDYPLVCIKLMIAIATFTQYPKSEICLQICRLLMDHIRKLTLIIHGPNHPLNHIWNDTLRISSGSDPGPLVLGVAVNRVYRHVASRPSHASGAFNEAYLRENLKVMAASPELLPQAQETRLALSEILIREGSILEGSHFYYQAIGFKQDDQLHHADIFRGKEGLKFQVSIYGKFLTDCFLEFP